MQAADRDALRCDMAQYYHVMDYRALPPELAACLAAGLPERSRSARRLAGDSPDPVLLLLAGILDQLRALCWDGNEDTRPPSVTEKLLGRGNVPKSDTMGFASAADFEAARAELLAKEAADHAG